MSLGKDALQVNNWNTYVGSSSHLTRHWIHCVSAMQFLENMSELHWNGVKCVFKYLKGPKEYKLMLGRNQEGLTGYALCSWALQDCRHSISACIFQINGGIVSWSSQKQSIIALSFTEAEFITLTYVSKEALWMLHLIY